MRSIILAIETAIDGGSISIQEKQTEIDFWIGRNSISKAEDILENIDLLLRANELNGENVEQIIVSGDVGSATGLKIGLATAKGLARSFPSRLIVASLIDSLVNLVSHCDAEKYIIALPVGRNSIFYKIFTPVNQIGAASIVRTEEFFEKMNNFEGSVYAHQKILKNKPLFDFKTDLFKNVGENMAKVISSCRV